MKNLIDKIKGMLQPTPRVEIPPIEPLPLAERIDILLNDKNNRGDFIISISHDQRIELRELMKEMAKIIK